ncbi:MAG: metallophosphoesterase [Nannocystaceae bacterium]
MTRLTLRLAVATLAPLVAACSGSSDDAGATDADTSMTEASATTTESATGSTSMSTATSASSDTSGSGSASMTGTSTGETTQTSDPTTTSTSATTADPTTTTGGESTGGETTGDTSGTTGDMPAEPLRFVVLGDGGEGNDNQYAVADIVEQVCADKGGCKFALYLGDNFYDDGVEAVDDNQFTTKFEEPYADLDFPFYVVFGNHDYGLNSFDWYKAEFEIEYSNYSDKWTMPNMWYEHVEGDVHFFALDTTRLMWDKDTSDQQNWLDQAVASSDAPWKIVFGHHPYVSDGAHGNAGNYEGLPFPDFVSGKTVKEFMDDSLCNKVDVYFCGHDHNRQWHQPKCGVEFVVSGAAAKTTDFEHHDNNPIFWEDDQVPGFLFVEIDGDSMYGAFYDRTGKLDFERTVTK